MTETTTPTTKQGTPKHSAGLSCATPMDSFIFQLALDLERVEGQMVNLAASLQRTMELTVASLKAGQSTNSLGILQGNGVELDRLSALRDQLANQLRVVKAQWLVTQMDLAGELEA